MFCPQCGLSQQHQHQDDIRFCSRCGLPLYEVNQWLEGGMSITNPEATMPLISTRRIHMIRAAKVAFFSGMLVPVGLLVGVASREPIWLLLPLLIFGASLVWMLYCRLFMDATPLNTPQRSKGFVPFQSRQYLSPQAVTPVLLDAHRANTAEMAQPPSITEYTTNLLPKTKRSQSFNDI